MTYDLSIQVKQDYIRAEVTGAREKGQEAADALAVWSSVAETCTKNEIFRVLAVFNLTGDLPTLAAYNIGTSLIKNDVLMKLRVALVDLNVNSQEINRFTVTVAENRSSYGRAEIFNDEKNAINWLLEKQQK